MIQYHYLIFGMKLTTDLSFAQLVPCADPARPTDLTVTAGEIPAGVYEREQDGLKYEFGDGESWLCNRTCYLYAERGERLTYRLRDGGNLFYLQTYILGWGMSMLAQQRGMIAMHCSAVADDKGALLIAGESGAGKSTLTTALLQRGYRLMADDMSWVEATPEGVFARPAFPYQKLCRDAALAQGYVLDELLYIDEDKDKYLVPYRGEFTTEPVRVKGFLMLGLTTGGQIVSGEITGVDKFGVIANNQFLRHLLGADKYRPTLGQRCLKIAAGIPIGYLLRPQGTDSMQEVVARACTMVAGFERAAEHI